MKRFFTAIFIFLVGLFVFSSCNMGEIQDAKLIIQNGCERQIYVALTAKEKTSEPTEDEYVKINSGMVHTFTGFNTESFKLWFKEFNESSWNTENFDNVGDYLRLKICWEAEKGGCYTIR